MNTRRLLSAIVIAGSAGVLLGCGGGGSSDPVAVPPEVRPAASDAVPASARQSARGLTDWLRALAMEGDVAETKSPLDVSSLQLPMADDAEATSVR